ncbi:MAG: 30S ribosomal protein S12 methylthiotransferase RimO [Gracilibacteraceae bacterium]|jgi:ribosomal protein S12 methylthiotransferase|nr:30S ribosomal protein S12 methylthiotransferase RimO [Gracilibacteraceae bacterium]
MEKLAIVHLGCPKNQVDGETLAGCLADRYTLTADPTEADVIVVNTCGFITAAKEESIDAIFQMLERKKTNPAVKVLAAGCLAQRYGAELAAAVPELDGVVGDDDIPRIADRIKATAAAPGRMTRPAGRRFLAAAAPPRRRLRSYTAYLKIAEGCDNRCTYCAIPAIKGPYRSRPLPALAAEAAELAESGAREIILVAQDTTRYGLDLYGGLKLPELLRRLARSGAAWLRLLYCYPELVTDELITVMGEETAVCHYMDLPLQHASDRVLSAMGRRGTAGEAAALIARLRTAIPDIVLRTTFITGFPGETEEDFRSLLDFVRAMRFDRLGVFAYSEEEGTPAAARADQVPPALREERRDRLMECQAEIAAAKQAERVGTVMPVLLEEKMNYDCWQGRSAGDAPETDGQVYVRVRGRRRGGDMVAVRIDSSDEYDLYGAELEAGA